MSIEDLIAVVCHGHQFRRHVKIWKCKHMQGIFAVPALFPHSYIGMREICANVSTCFKCMVCSGLTTLTTSLEF